MDFRSICSILHSLPVFVLLHQLSSFACANSTSNQCKFKANTQQDQNHLKELGPLIGKTYTAKYRVEDQDRDYTFYIGICAQPCPASLKAELKCDSTVAVVQTWRDKDTGKLEKRVAGRLNNTYILGTDRWKMMTYSDGDAYHHHCTLDNKRQAHIMFTCDESIADPQPKVLEENSQRNESCYYLIEISTNALCPKAKVSGVSAGSVIVIIVAVSIGCYLVFGCIYRRVVVGAKGMDQVPNLPFWQKLGNFMADGCDYFFRSNPESISQRPVPGSSGGYEPVSSSPGGRAYKGLGDNILSNEETNPADDSLLPM